MPLDLAQLTRRLASSYQPSEPQPYSLEASFQTVLEEEQRIYGICERRGIVLEEDALPLRENTLPQQEERAELLRQESPHFSPLYISIFTFALIGTISSFYAYNTLAQERKTAEEIITAGMAILLTFGLAGLAYGVLGVAAQRREEEYFALKKEMKGLP